jgi:hypothetical protein
MSLHEKDVVVKGLACGEGKGKVRKPRGKGRSAVGSR